MQPATCFLHPVTALSFHTVRPAGHTQRVSRHQAAPVLPA